MLSKGEILKPGIIELYPDEGVEGNTIFRIALDKETDAFFVQIGDYYGKVLGYFRFENTGTRWKRKDEESPLFVYELQQIISNEKSPFPALLLQGTLGHPTELFSVSPTVFLSERIPFDSVLARRITEQVCHHGVE